MKTLPIRFARTRFVTAIIPMALILGLASANMAKAGAVYEFSLPADGAVGTLDIKLTFPALLPTGALSVIPLTGSQVTSVTSGTPIDLATSAIGIEVTPTTTLFGVALLNAAQALVLLNVTAPSGASPGDFFVFSRTPAGTGAFTSTAGTVTSDSVLGTSTPVGTLDVSETSVPEPSSALFLTFGLMGISSWRLRRRSA